MREQFQSINFHGKSIRRLEICNTIIEDYFKQGLRLTLRQLYYQLVTRNEIANSEAEYQKLSILVSNGRLAGLLDWDGIEDRTRVPRVPLEFQDLGHRMKSALANYRLPRWEGQEHYVELWVEKEALAGVLMPLAQEFHVTLMVNKGYSSQSAMYESAQRFKEECGAEVEEEESEEDRIFYPARYMLERTPILFYLGDHDPSGEDMVRDIRARLELFGVTDIDVRKLALTRAQIDQYKPPPNPAKITDRRAAAYIAKHGAHSWEVDALNPATLTGIIREAFGEVVDTGLMDAVIEREEADKDRLSKAVGSLTEE